MHENEARVFSSILKKCTQSELKLKYQTSNHETTKSTENI